jgi:hypothetical protein
VGRKTRFVGNRNISFRSLFVLHVKNITNNFWNVFNFSELAIMAIYLVLDDQYGMSSSFIGSIAFRMRR